MKEEATDYLEIDTLRNLIKKYSQFITFPIYLWSSKVRSQLSSSSVNSRRKSAFACRPNMCLFCVWLDYMSPVWKWSFSFQGKVYIYSFVLFIFQFYICRYFHFLKTITLYFQIPKLDHRYYYCLGVTYDLNQLKVIAGEPLSRRLQCKG